MTDPRERSAEGGAEIQRHTITCEPLHIAAATELLHEELKRFDKYTRVGWGWGYGNYRTGPRLFVRRLKNGLSVTQLRTAPQEQERG